jgi:RNA polymerase sigma-70 factor, ECF subfamily
MAQPAGLRVNTTDDTKLMLEVRQGRTGALAVLFERHHARLYRFCLRMTGDRHASEDLVQDAFMRMLKYRNTFRPETPFLPWMFRIARNACVDHLRRSSVEPTPSADIEQLAENAASRSHDTASDDRGELVRRALLALPATVREVLVLNRFEFKTYEEIAAVLGCSAGAVRVRAHRAMKQLRQAYLELCEEIPE